ncbi:hypothetical protein [Streptomyces melanogenes]|uniref:hypothetical protein n=1 Tax=Streptomyces melanogenes TaxID=67326 RepID=UPI0037BD4FD3
MTRTIRNLALGAALCVLAGCSSSGDFTVPDALCGVTVGSKPLAPLLPDGEKLEQSPKAISPESSVCSVSVDKKQAVYVTDDVTDAGTDPVAVQRDALARMGNPQKAAVGDDARIADQGGVAVGVCTYQGSRRKFVTLVDLTSEHPVPKRTADRRKALESFLRAYLPKAMEAKGCRK